MSELIFKKNDELPKGWITTNIGSFCHVTKLAGFEYTKHFNLKSTGDIPVVKAQNISMGKFVEKKIDYISKKISDSLPRSQLHGREILMSFVGSVGNVCLSPENKRWHLGPNAAKIDPSKIDKKYLCYYLESPLGYSQAFQKKKSTSQPSISMSEIRTILVNISPLNEQKRIVEKIEELFSKIDFQIEIIKQTTNLLKLNKKIILRDGFNGKLTKKWRKTHTLKNPNLLLDKIENERKNKNLEKFDRQISTSYDSENNLMFSTLGFVTENLDGKRIPISRIKRKDMHGKYPYYGASGIIDYVNKPLFQGKHLLIGEDGANLLSRSTPIAFLADGEFWVNNHAHVLRPLGEIPFEYISYFVNSIDLSEWVTGTAQPKLNQRNMNKILIPIPSIDEQLEIVKIFQQNLSLIDKSIEMLKIWNTRLTILRISILKQSFEGKLVPQNSNDESAEILLQKIKQEKEKYKEKIKLEKQQSKQKASRSKKNVK